MENADGRNHRWLAIAGKVLALLWAGSWTFWTLAALVGEGGLIDTLLFGFWLGPAELIIALIAVRWEKLGGVLLILAGVVWAYILPQWYAPSTSMTAFALLAGAAPPLLAGIMLLLSSQRSKEEQLGEPGYKKTSDAGYRGEGLGSAVGRMVDVLRLRRCAQ